MTSNSQQTASMAQAYTLASLFMMLPDERFAQAVRDGEVQRAMSDIAERVQMPPSCRRKVANACSADGFAQTDASDLEDELRQEFTRLFTNPERSETPVYEAVFKNPGRHSTEALTFISPTAIDAERIYKTMGMRVHGRSNESPDYMGIELDFMALLYRAEAGDDEALARKARKAHVAFDRGHLLKWGPRFFERVADASSHPLFAAFGVWGTGLMQVERRRCEGLEVAVAADADEATGASDDANVSADARHGSAVDSDM